MDSGGDALGGEVAGTSAGCVAHLRGRESYVVVIQSAPVFLNNQSGQQGPVAVRPENADDTPWPTDNGWD